jgi:hypothetical protein
MVEEEQNYVVQDEEEEGYGPMLIDKLMVGRN